MFLASSSQPLQPAPSSRPAGALARPSVPRPAGHHVLLPHSCGLRRPYWPARRRAARDSEDTLHATDSQGTVTTRRLPGSISKGTVMS